MKKPEAIKIARATNYMLRHSKYMAIIERLYRASSDEIVESYYVSIIARVINPTKFNLIQKAPN